MNNKTKALALMALLYSPLNFADYQLEFNGGFQSIDLDPANVDQYVLSGDFYFDPVDTRKGPLAEAAFLNKASSAGIHYTEVEEKITFPGFFVNDPILGPIFVPPQTITADYSNVGIQGRFVQGEIVVEGSIDRGDNDGFSLAGGTYLNDKTEVLLGISDYDRTDETIFVKAKSFFTTGMNKTLVGNGRVQIHDGDLGVQLGADYYLNKTTSVGAEAGVFFENNTRSSALVKARHFFNENLSLDAKLGFYDVSETDTLFALGVTGRF